MISILRTSKIKIALSTSNIHTSHVYFLFTSKLIYLTYLYIYLLILLTYLYISTTILFINFQI